MLKPVALQTSSGRLNADLVMPSHTAQGLVMFAHGSGSSRLSPRNRAVAAGLQQRGLASLLLDLLTDEEERVDAITREFRFDIPRLAARLAEATEWTDSEAVLAGLPLGYFGASTGAAAALIAASYASERVSAVVSRGGRPDLAADRLPYVSAPTLLIVGGDDPVVLDLNEKAAARMRCQVRIAVVPGATHLFEEPGALERVTELAGAWFLDYLAAAT